MSQVDPEVHWERIAASGEVPSHPLGGDQAEHAGESSADIRAHRRRGSREWCWESWA